MQTQASSSTSDTDAIAHGVATPDARRPTLQKLFGNRGTSGSNAPRGRTVQRTGTARERAARTADPDITPPINGIDKAGFIDTSDGAFIRTGPREAGGTPVRAEPLPPATRVFATGRHASAPEWIYVTALLPNEMVRGYVQGSRINFDLPEPLAELRQLHGGETAEGLAKEKFGHAARDGHDLRFYENVLLYVNQGRTGIAGAYQSPGALGGGANNIRLTAGHRIWLVSAAFAKSLESVVPSGSLTGGAVAKARRFAGHVQDILHSVTESRHYLGEVAGEYAQAIHEHQNAILGIVGGFLMAEAASALLAATPTGVTQIIAVLIQLILATMGAAGTIEAGAAAMQHGAAWLTTAWTANSNAEKLADASRAFIKMLVSLAMAALSYVGAKGNYGNAVKIAGSMPTGGLPALAVVGGGQMGGAGVHSSVLVGPSTGSLGVGGAMMSKVEGESDSGPEAPKTENAKGQPHATTETSDTPALADAPTKLTGPSGKPDPSARPSGPRAAPRPSDSDPVNIRALAQENDSADVLAKHGYRVEQGPKVSGRKNPDFRIEGEIFDNYAPTTSSPRSIWTTIEGKVLEEQARRIVLNLSSSGVDLAKLKAQFVQWPIDNLEQIIVVKGSSVIRFWP